ncbi:MAG: cytochrome c3 family protein [Desulfocapsaceae bacterium]|nr:cytochrome c3 family protein [Desulfocapsaceae bacterium]
MNTNKASTINLLALAAFLATSLLANASMAEEAYDADKYGPQEPIVWTTPTKATFTHQTHTMDAGLACDTCHDEIFAMEQGSAEKAGDFSMKSFKEGKYCGSCHDGKTAFNAATQCGSCHSAPETPIIFTAPVKAVSFEHSIHLKKGCLTCEACHKDVFAMKKGGVEEAEKTGTNQGDKREYLEKLHNKYCGTCHNASQAFGYLTRCTVCHIGVKGQNSLQGGNQKKQGHGDSKH